MVGGYKGESLMGLVKLQSGGRWVGLNAFNFGSFMENLIEGKSESKDITTEQQFVIILIFRGRTPRNNIVT